MLGGSDSKADSSASDSLDTVAMREWNSTAPHSTSKSYASCPQREAGNKANREGLSKGLVKGNLSMHVFVCFGSRSFFN